MVLEMSTVCRFTPITVKEFFPQWQLRVGRWSIMAKLCQRSLEWPLAGWGGDDGLIACSKFIIMKLLMIDHGTNSLLHYWWVVSLIDTNCNNWVKTKCQLLSLKVHKASPEIFRGHVSNHKKDWKFVAI